MDFKSRALFYVFDKKLFVSYQPVNEEAIFTTADGSCKVYDVPIVNVMMFNEVTRTQSGVSQRTQKENLLSLTLLQLCSWR